MPMQRPIPRVGQKLWMVDGRRSRYIKQHEVEVTKIGRKYFTVVKTDDKWKNEIRCHLNDWRIDCGGYTSDGECYLSKEEYELKIKTSNAWTAFYRAIQNRYNPVAGVSYENIIEAAKLLNLKLDLE